MHLFRLDALCDVFDSLLTRLVLALDRNHDPVIEHVKHLVSLTLDLVQNQCGPGEEQIQSHGKVLPLFVQYAQDFLVKRKDELFVEKRFDLHQDRLCDLEEERALTDLTLVHLILDVGLNAALRHSFGDVF